ncbi:MAG: hypothetical protein ACI9MC_002098 [Kiritimatiellia bacterium]|jgi:hypothetical protein
MHMSTPISPFAAIALLALLGCPASETDATDAQPSNLNDIVSTARPDRRSEVIAIPHERTNSIMIFGGNDGPIVAQIPRASYRGDTWIFEPGHGWTDVTTDVSPSARGRYGAVLDDTNGRALTFAGRWRETGTTGNYTLYNDIWSFDFATHSWTQIDDGTSGNGPSPRYYPAAHWDDATSTMYVYGGAVNANPMRIEASQEVWSWTEAAGWKNLSTTQSGDLPSRRVFFGSTWDSQRQRMLVFGGQVGDFQSMAYNELFSFEVATGQWTKLNDGRGTAPSTRMHGHLDYDAVNDRYLLFGGHTDFGDANDLWSLDPKTNEWSVVYQADVIVGDRFGCVGNPTEVPADYVDQDLSAPERRHRGMHALMYNNLWIFAGLHAECSAHLDDTWRFDLGANQWHELLEARSGESCARRDEDCECLCL